MLVSKKYDANAIVCFKIVNGDEIVGKLVEETEEGYVVNRPTTVVPSQQGFGLLQSLITGDINTNVTLKKSHVIMHAPVIKDMESHYIQTTTGIAPATKSGIIT
jgi:hypothetical protein